MGVLDLIKLAGSTVSSLLVIGGFLVSLVKPWRQRFVAWIRKTSEVDTQKEGIKSLEKKMDLQDKEIKKSIEELMTLMQDHVNKDKEKAEITRILLSSDRDIIRCQITEIYYHYCTEKKLPVYERENLVYL